MNFIKLENISMSYPLFNAAPQSFKKELIRFTSFGKIRNDNIPKIDALDGINFTLTDGDRLGLIGHNGAGKSTLLKLLATIFPPTHGSYSHKGKIVSTLNMHLGFNPEATGFENIITRCLFHNIKLTDIKNIYLDDIVSFSGLKDYLNLPLSTYSSGMQLRLAFSIITSINADILLMDEVIGVGDKSFMEKATIRLEEFINRAKIIVFTSHNLSLVKKFCNKAILLESGKQKFIGSVEDAIDIYNVD